MHGQQTVPLDINNNAAAYVEDFLECVENLPVDMQRHITRLRELDVEHEEILRELETDQKKIILGLDTAARKRCLKHMQQRLIQTQEISDAKLQVAQELLDDIETSSRQLEQCYKNMGPKVGAGKDQENSEPGGRMEVQQPERSSKRTRRQCNDVTSVATLSVPDAVPERVEERPTVAATVVKKTKKKKRRNKVDKDRDYSPIEQPVDPDEPVYCLCQQISFGEMICCDNDRCTIEWFHFVCVGLANKPKGKWFCPNCRGDRPNIQKPRS